MDPTDPTPHADPARRQRPSWTTAASGIAASGVAAVHAALLWIYYRPSSKRLAGDEQMYLDAAETISRGDPSPLELLWPPLYPYFVAALKLPGEAPLLAVQMAQLALLVLTAFLLGDIARRLFGPGPAVPVAVLGTLAFPPLAAFAYFLWPEIPHLALWVGALWILVSQKRHPAWMAALGALLGVAFLTKSLLGPFLPALLLPLLFAPGRHAPEWRRGGLRIAIVLAAFVSTLAPSLISNYRQHGLLMIADSSRFNLWLGLNDHSRQSLRDSIAWETYLDYRRAGNDFRSRNAALEGKIRRHIHQHGPLEVLGAQLGKQYFRLFDQGSYLTAQLPSGALWGPDAGYPAPSPSLAAALRGLSTASYALLLAGACLGMLFLSPIRHPWLGLLLAFLLYNLALFLFLHVTARYRIQMMPVFLLYAGGALSRATQGGLRGPKRRLLAALAIATLLFLAFGAPLLGPLPVPS